MSIQRLKFAQARGARIEYKDPQDHKSKWTTTPAPCWYPWHEYRVHPGDAHLEYGPISRRLREAALHGSTPMNYVLDADDNHEMDLRSKALDYVQCNLASHDGQDNCRTYLLFEAERLADEGL